MRMASMRPRHRCRGNRVDDRSRDIHLHASMRPRHRCRGNRRCMAMFCATLAASMRPRHRCRGNPYGPVTSGAGPTWASMRPRHRCRGNPWHCGTRRAGYGGFNEAAASLPRKSGSEILVPRQQLASMRPRHRCRGNRDAASVHLLHFQRFNEAAASLPRKSALAEIGHQRGIQEIRARAPEIHAQNWATGLCPDGARWKTSHLSKIWRVRALPGNCTSITALASPGGTRPRSARGSRRGNPCPSLSPAGLRGQPVPDRATAHGHPCDAGCRPKGPEARHVVWRRGDTERQKAEATHRSLP